jgi:ADP-heptose:LPS heptosyltransferase
MNLWRKARNSGAFARKLWWSWGVIRRHGRPSVLLQFHGGLGDHLLLTCIARELKRQGERCIWVATWAPELFRGNPDVRHVIPALTDDLHWLLRTGGGRVPALIYAPHLPAERRDVPPAKHLIAIMCEQAGVRGTIVARPYLHLTPAELAGGRHAPRQIAIQSTGRAASNFMWTKEWYPERFQEVVNRLKDRVTFVQVGSAKDVPLAGAIDLRGRTGMRETAAVMAASEAFVGLVGFPMHLARAVDCPAVIVYGGRELPSQSGYTANLNLTGEAPCAPCWRYDDCPGQRSCMDQIGANRVVAALEQLLAAPPARPLATQSFPL